MGNMKRGIEVIFVIIFLTISVFLMILSNFTKWESGKDIVKECESDADCVKVQTSCCPCSSGGEEKCVPVSKAENYTASLSECGKDIFCAQVYNCKIEKCSCIEGKCQ